MVFMATARRYEKGSVGGRLKSLHIGDHPFELGGSMVYEGNEYIRHALLAVANRVTCYGHTTTRAAGAVRCAAQPAQLKAPPPTDLSHNGHGGAAGCL